MSKLTTSNIFDESTERQNPNFKPVDMAHILDISFGTFCLCLCAVVAVTLLALF